ncbi:hypothetical protein [Anaerosinus gibii]|uniref:Uncharacterized protein n=1 Tax=Selenobaculum gibii TaxID=3054208 RepID=A0A9Y2ETG4_9FIRM|nr:hypothetical protein [Selenobaculum gbiensis]WIW69965.1 hypothetical protein P3F81_08550 [Selenobaculum gbiensis]
MLRLSKLEWITIILGIILLLGMDFQNLKFLDILCLSTYGIWIILKIVVMMKVKKQNGNNKKGRKP